ncbi:MAG: rRNA pseudouridine synthase [Saprospiraceae bacterium]|nr:rRNA pseudouridine synthase [Saprospiraceae bacterium]
MKNLRHSKKNFTPKEKDTSSDFRLNKYIAHCGICSRRDAAALVKSGQILVNDKVEENPAYLVQAQDKVKYQGKLLKRERTKIYLLLNKPKNVITTLDDERGRRTVYDLIKSEIQERVYPVGRLDRNTTGLLILTNDGDLAQKLSHPSYKIKKLYHAKLNKALTKRDFEAIVQGVMLEDGIAEVDSLDYVQEKKDEIGIQIHSGKNRIVRRIFEKLGYEVEKLDRVLFAGLTKKNLPRGHYRPLTEQEVINLKHFRSR